MTEDEFGDRLRALEYELIDAQTVRHERAIYDKMIALFGEYGDSDLTTDLLGSIRYQKFLVREAWQNVYDKAVFSLPKPLRWIVRKLQWAKKMN